MSTNQKPKAPITKLECCLYKDTASPFFDSGTIKEKHIAKWLGGTLTESPDQKPLVAGLRLIFVKQPTWDSYPFDNVAGKEIHRVLGLPEETYGHLLLQVPVCGKFSISPTQSVYISWRVATSDSLGLLIKHDAVSRISVGYVLLGGSQEADAILNAIRELFVLDVHQHPLLIPIILLERIILSVSLFVSRVDFRLYNFERTTGFANWGVEMVEGRENLDFPTLINNLGRMNFDFSATICVTIDAGLKWTEFILKELEAERKKDDGIDGCNLVQRVEFVKSRLEHLLVFGGIKERLQSQQAILFNLIAQQDSGLNISIASDSRELAAASKRDSSAMKIIAILTTLFLPGTFISALFAMPMFDWEASSVSEASKGNHLWFYWAVAIPLTTIVMAIVGAYAWYQGRINAVNAKRARESAKKRVKEV